MPTSKAQQRATNKYIAKAYDRINLTVSKGKKDDIKAAAAIAGESMNQYIINAVDQRMERDSATAEGGEDLDGERAFESD